MPGRPGVARLILLLFLSRAMLSHASSPLEALLPAAATEQNAPAAKTEPPAQPVPYSHKKHLAMGLQCQECHPNPEPGDRMTFPASSKCMACHTTIARDKPAIQKLAEFAKSGSTIPWVRVYVLPAWVYWNHRSHLEAHMTCDMCHGQVADMDIMARVTNSATMAGCIECHRKNDVSTGCKYCHGDK